MQANPQELRLLENAKRGDRSSFERLYQLSYVPVYALAYGALRERNAAAGVLQETFTTAWTNLGTVPASEPFGRWVQRVCFLHCDAYLRRTGRAAELADPAAQELLADADPDTFRIPQPYTVYPELKARLERVVSALPDRQRRALILYYNNGLDLTDTAAVMGVRPAQARTYLARARREIVTRLLAEERAAGERLPWDDETAMTPFRDSMQAYTLSGMIAGGAAGLILNQIFASAAAGGASAAAGTAAGVSVGTATSTTTGAAVSTTVGTAVGMSTITKVILGVTAAAVVAGGGYGVHKIVQNNRAPEPGAVTESAELLSEVRCYSADGALMREERYDYDENCLVVRTDSSEYDPDGTPVFEDMPHVYEYDDTGRAVNVRIGDSPVIECDYDDAGHLVREYQGDSNGNPVTYTYEYDADGHRIRMVRSFYGTVESSWRVTERKDADGGVTYEMTLENGPEGTYPIASESYDAQGRKTGDTAEGEIRYYYHDEKGLVLMESAAGDGLGEGSPYAGLNLVLLDAVNREYHSLYLGVGADAAKTYDDEGRLARLDFTDGSYAEFSYRENGAEPSESPESSEEPEQDPYYGYGALIEEIAGYLRNRSGEPANSPLVHLLGDAMMSGESTPGYAFMDLDGDGVMELLIGTSEPDNYSQYRRTVGNIYALYTMRSGQPYSVHVSGVRYMLSLCSDGSLRELSIGSAFLTCYRYFHYSGDQLIPFELVFMDSWYTQENGLPDLPFYNTNGNSEDHSQQITQEQADEIIMTKHVPTEIDYQPFPV